VANDLNNLHMRMDADVRLAAAAGAVARFLGDSAGLANSTIARLQSTVIAACTQAFEQLTHKHPYLELQFLRYSDRIEVALSHQGDVPPAVGLDAGAGFAKSSVASASASSPLAGVDRVQCETHDGEIVTRLTKYVGKEDLSLQ
jgi:hypothetical protein